MRDKITLVSLLCKDLLENVTAYVDADEMCEAEWKAYREGKIHNFPYNPITGNRDFGKTALKRKITTLRHELLALERMLGR